jgi:quercetin dioxygenase-like cupin family protein
MAAMLTAMHVDYWNSRRDGTVTEVALRRRLESCGYQVSACAWAVGTVIPPEAQDCERVDAVVAGVVMVTLDGESTILTSGDMVYVPRGAVRRVEVIGSFAALCLDGVHRP